MISFNKVGIIGAGSYGTAVAQCFSSMVKEVLLVSDNADVTLAVNKSHMNPKFIPEVLLDEKISCTNVFSDVCNSDIIFIAVPVAAVASVCNKLKEHKITVPIVLCSKGFCIETGQLQSDLFEEILDNDYEIFSGPSFASEISRGLPAGVNIAGKNYELSVRIAECLSSQTFKIEPIHDYIGLQVAGALKNVLAIGCGIFSGLKLGSSAISKFIVSGLREVAELSVALGGQKSTIYELGGIGDTILTCTSRQSRNILFGEHIAAGGTIDNWNGPLAEGIFAAKAIPTLKQNHCLKLKIFSEIYKIIYEKKSVNQDSLL
ncbi:MAG: NAD(P)H-dependent glycerol-3-phosphate dehydrogenase [Holosporaceae bacterium]|jgi:glycerol-3-phosphate dehydrogenase (NAD(P)+)|nr:NAD(P)H-dependent glycerol-3-phosphate dehydrogenase [Holosporaceae bacterium]